MKIYIAYDLEATCWDQEIPGNRQKQKEESEIIEIGAVKYFLDGNGDFHKMQDFCQIVRPEQNIQLSEYCTNLTSITQDMVNGQDTLFPALRKFYRYAVLGSQSIDDIVFLSWGFYDRTMIEKEVKRKRESGFKHSYFLGHDLLYLLDKCHHSLKHKFMEKRGLQKCGLNKALQMLNIPFEGTQHRGIDDARMIGKVFEQVREELGL